jgi:hypothetical protein
MAAAPVSARSRRLLLSANSQAAAMLSALSWPGRLTLLSTVARRQDSGQDRSLVAVADVLRVSVRALVKEVARLQ